MSGHELKWCPRCGSGFECKVGTILQCQCSGIAFNEREKEHIAENYKDCLCRDCLLDMKKELRYKPLQDRIDFILSIFKSR